MKANVEIPSSYRTLSSFGPLANRTDRQRKKTDTKEEIDKETKIDERTLLVESGVLGRENTNRSNEDL